MGFDLPIEFRPQVTLTRSLQRLSEAAAYGFEGVSSGAAMLQISCGTRCNTVR
jgi:hypothetical protein